MDCSHDSAQTPGNTTVLHNKWTCLACLALFSKNWQIDDDIVWLLCMGFQVGYPSDCVLLADPSYSAMAQSSHRYVVFFWSVPNAMFSFDQSGQPTLDGWQRISWLFDCIERKCSITNKRGCMCCSSSTFGYWKRQLLQCTV